MSSFCKELIIRFLNTLGYFNFFEKAHSRIDFEHLVFLPGHFYLHTTLFKAACQISMVSPCVSEFNWMLVN